MNKEKVSFYYVELKQKEETLFQCIVCVFPVSIYSQIPRTATDETHLTIYICINSCEWTRFANNKFIYPTNERFCSRWRLTQRYFLNHTVTMHTCTAVSCQPCLSWTVLSGISTKCKHTRHCCASNCTDKHTTQTLSLPRTKLEIICHGHISVHIVLSKIMKIEIIE